MKIIGSTWRTGMMGAYGVVAVERHDGWKAYLGEADGYDEDKDADAIAQRGAPLMEGEARGFFPQFEDRPYDY